MLSSYLSQRQSRHCHWEQYLQTFDSVPSDSWRKAKGSYQVSGWQDEGRLGVRVELSPSWTPCGNLQRVIRAIPVSIWRGLGGGVVWLLRTCVPANQGLSGYSRHWTDTLSWRAVQTTIVINQIMKFHNRTDVKPCMVPTVQCFFLTTNFNLRSNRGGLWWVVGGGLGTEQLISGIMLP